MINEIIFALLGLGMLFQIIGSVALHRFPDLYTRLHGATKCTTLGSILVYLAVVVFGISLMLNGEQYFGILSVHTMIVLVMLLVTNPTGAHAIARAAHRHGDLPKRACIDRLKEDSR
ncbi:MAG: monovalent cation/H(+) antiporter subunit G [archaeon]